MPLFFLGKHTDDSHQVCGARVSAPNHHDSDDRKVQYGDDCDTSSVGDFSRYLGFVPFIFHSTKLIICGNVSFQINQPCTRSPLDSDLAVGAE